MGDPLLGAQVGRYQIAQLIGEGGMGRVYLAVQPEIGARVAIKVLADQAATLADRFFAEARVANLIRDEHVVDVIDCARLPDGRPYIVMEYVDGRTLRDLVDHGELSVGAACSAMIEVLSALAAAHAVGIVHRDLKPDNVMITKGGHAKVLDFGIAKLAPELTPRPIRTQTGAAIGTPAYMSPEQIGGAPVDPRTDVYGAGLVLFEALVGRRPFDAPSDFEMMRAHIELAPPRPTSLRPELPAALDEVILNALAKRPDDRFRSATAMARALEHVVDQLPPALRRRSSFPPPSRVHAAAKSEPTAGSTIRERPSHRPLPQPLPQPPHASPRARRRWPAFVVAAAMLAAGGIAVAIVATRSSSSPTAAPQAVRDAGIDARAVVARAVPRDAGPADAPLNVATTIDGPLDHFDPSAYLPNAEELARRLAPDARVIIMAFEGVASDGTLATRKDSLENMYIFTSPSRGEVHNGQPAQRCQIHLMIRGGQAEALLDLPGQCTRPAPPRPRCTFAEVWARAKKRGARADLIATVRWTGWWYFEIRGTRDEAFHVRLADDCGLPPPAKQPAHDPHELEKPEFGSRF